ncbi:MAG: Transposase family, partial [Chlamydiales bacterium]|nr:Transposase family [Chlamydiales bacterium]
SRSQGAFRRVFGDYSGALTTDRYEVYCQHKGPRQLCHAHIRRDFIKISEREGENQNLGLELLELNNQLFHIYHQYKKGSLDRLEYMHKIEEEIMPSMHTWLILGTHSYRYCAKTKGTCKRLLRDWSHLWTFLYIPDVEPTNNLAERDLRPIVIRRKISFGLY